MNIIARLKFVFTYYDVSSSVVHSHKAMGTPHQKIYQVGKILLHTKTSFLIFIVIRVKFRPEDTTIEIQGL